MICQTINANSLRRSKLDALQKQQEDELKEKLKELKTKKEEGIEVFMASFKKDHQGVITSSGAASLTPILDDNVPLQVLTCLLLIN
jgi:hypothetical protein